MGRAFFTVIAAIAQLERELIVERVKNGLRNARLKGKHIGRKKTRPSDLIRALLKSGMTYRQISKIAEVSSGAVSAELRALRKEIEMGITPASVLKPKAESASKGDKATVKLEEEPKIELEFTRW